MSADPKCIFGISRRPASLPSTALQINAFFDGRNYMMLSAPGDRVYWFLFEDMEKAAGRHKADMREVSFRMAQGRDPGVTALWPLGPFAQGARLHTSTSDVHEVNVYYMNFERLEELTNLLSNHSFSSRTFFIMSPSFHFQAPRCSINGIRTCSVLKFSTSGAVAFPPS